VKVFHAMGDGGSVCTGSDKGYFSDTLNGVTCKRCLKKVDE